MRYQLWQYIYINNQIQDTEQSNYSLNKDYFYLLIDFFYDDDDDLIDAFGNTILI